jgi:hypothetical protein
MLVGAPLLPGHAVPLNATDPPRRGEETDVVIRILQSGATGYWLPQARVAHCSNHNQQTLRYVAGYFAIAGETQSFMERKASGPLLFGVPRWLWRQLLQSWALYQLHRIISPPPVWLPHLRAYAIAYGAIRYWRGEAAPPAATGTIKSAHEPLFHADSHSTARGAGQASNAGRSSNRQESRLTSFQKPPTHRCGP